MLRLNKVVLYFLAAALIWMTVIDTQADPLQYEAQSSWHLTPIEPARVVTTSEFSKGEAQNLIDGSLFPQVTFSQFKGAAIHIKLDQPRFIEALGVLRPGWSTWSFATVIDLRVNGGAPRRIELTNDPIAPNAKDLDSTRAQIIPIGQRVRTLEITVVEAESKSPFNTVGTVEILEASGGPDVLDFARVEGVPEDSAGVNLRFDLDQPASQVHVKLYTGNYPFKRIGAHVWTTMIERIPAGQSTVTIPWEQFQNPAAPQRKLNPLNAYKIEIDRTNHTDKSHGLKSWSFTKSETKLKPAWEQIETIAHPADEAGWRPGIPSQGFGRFGWTAADGLLVGNISDGNFEYMMLNRENDGRKSTFRFFVGEDDRPHRWTRRYVDWTGVVHQVLRGAAAEKSWAVDNKKKPMPMSLIYSILAPGFLVDSDKQQFTFGPDSESSEPPQLLYVGRDGLRWVSAQDGLQGDRMAEGWLVAVWPEQPQMPILFAPKHRPTKIYVEGAMLVFEFSESVDRIAVGTPAGFRWWEGDVGTPDRQSRDLALRSQTLAAVLRAYPKTSRMQFKDEKSLVRVRETFGHLVWDNDWNEPSRVIAPVSPMLSFAADMDYPLELPDDLKDLQIPTKVGPYRYAEGATVEYELPLPPTAGRMYLRPAGEHALADDIASKLTQAPKRRERWLETTTNIAPWMIWTSRSLGLTLMDEQQRRDFIDAWKMVFDDTVKPHPWYVRTEPWSGQKYIYSYAWIDVTNRTFGDITSGHGAVLYAANLYARASGDWDMVERNWPLFNAVMQYYKMHHDWCYMQGACHESGGDSAFDMELISYLGALGYMRMAEALGKEDDAAFGRLLVARFSVPFSMRWLGAKWVAPDLAGSGDSVPFSSPGLTDGKGFVQSQTPHWKIGLSLSWKGPSPEAYEAQLWGGGEEFWRFLEYELIESIEPSLWTEKNWYRPKNVVAHLYMRGLLGASSDELLGALEKQGESGVLGLSPKTAEAREYAPIYAMAIGKQFPVIIKDWGRAALISGVYDAAEERAFMKFDGEQPFVVTLELEKPAKAHRINGMEKGALEVGDQVRIDLPAGEVALEIDF